MRYKKWLLPVVIVVSVLTATTSPAARPSFITIDVPGAESTQAFGISNKDDIVGFYSVGINVHGFLLHRGDFTTIDVPPELSGTDGCCGRATAGRTIGINDRHDIVGFYFTTRQNSRGFLLDSGAFTSIDAFGAFNTRAFGINNHGVIVGVYGSDVSPVLNGEHGFVLNRGEFTSIDVPSAFTHARGSNDR